MHLCITANFHPPSQKSHILIGNCSFLLRAVNKSACKHDKQAPWNCVNHGSLILYTTSGNYQALVDFPVEFACDLGSLWPLIVWVVGFPGHQPLGTMHYPSRQTYSNRWKIPNVCRSEFCSSFYISYVSSLEQTGLVRTTALGSINKFFIRIGCSWKRATK